MRAATYTLRIESDTPIGLLTNERERLQNALQHAEDVVNDALPEGFSCKIAESGEGVNLEAVARLEEMADDQGR